MSIINVKPEWNEIEAGITNTEEYVVEKYTVAFDNGDNPKYRSLMARDASGIPIRGKGHDYKQWLVVTEKTVRVKEGPFLYEVSVKYSRSVNPSSAGGDRTAIPPWDEPKKVRWGSIPSNEKIYRDVTGKRICTTAYEPYDPPVTEDFYDTTLTITVNKKTFDPVKIARFRNSVNTGSFYGFTAGSVLCVDITADEAWYGKTKYYIITYEFRIKTAEGSIDGKADWIRRIPDEGTRVRGDCSNVLLATNNGGKQIVDSDGNPVTEPVLLNGGGELLNGPGPVFWNEFTTKKSKSFTELGVS